MDWLVIIFLIYMFIAFYFSFLFLSLHLRYKNRLYEYVKTNHKDAPGVSIIVPAYNRDDTIEGTVSALLNLDYPKEKLEIIVIDDGSTDRTFQIASQFRKQGVIVLRKNNSGKASTVNFGISKAKKEFIAVVDADSEPEPDSLIKMVGFFQDKKIAAVTSTVLVKNIEKPIERFQQIEYFMMAWNRKLLDFLDCVYVTPGPLSVYRKKVLLEVGGFDPKNSTEDIEITWHILSHGYKAKMCLAAKAKTTVPDKFKQWWNQRLRWDIGGNQTIWKYKRFIMKDTKNMLGFFVIPFFIMSLFFGLLGVIVFSALFIRNFIFYLLSSAYKANANVPILSLAELHITPSVLNYLGLVLVVFGFVMISMCMKAMGHRKENIFNLIFYGLFYLMAYPFVLLHSCYKLAIRDIKW
jgi:cellulose synthase/poly-beta-1,6-N-acetylglucosamine synthase-like glycosyltransferase